MSDTELVGLDKIFPNPWQPRTTEDAEQIKKIAHSIAADGLLQPPVARKVSEGRYELAFGHTRYQAYRYLMHVPPEWFGEHGYKTLYYGQMPLHVMELTDEAMFRHAVSENIQRKDLDAVEEAQAMRRAQVDFGYTSEQVGALFGKSGATVRGLVRLLDLPETAQQKIRNGEMSQGTARQLLAAAPLLPQAKLDALAEKLAANPGQAQNMVEWDIRSELDRNAQEMPADMTANELWPLDWQAPASLPYGERVAKHWKGQKHFGPLKRTAAQVFDEIAALHQGGMTWEAIADGYPDWVEAVAFYKMFAEPPVCQGCPVYGKFGGKAYCRVTVCYQNKKAIWLQQSLQELSAKTGIKIHDIGVDGDGAQLNEPYMYGYAESERQTAEAIKAERRARYEQADPHLRLALVDDRYGTNRNWLTGRLRIKVLDCSPAVKAAREKEAQTQRENEARRAQQDEKWERHRRMRPLSASFVANVAAPAFSPAFAKMDNVGALMLLLAVGDGIFPQKAETPRKEKLAMLHQRLANKALDNLMSFEVIAEGPVYIATKLQEIATTVGVKLPADWLMQAQGYEQLDEPVAAATVEDDEDEDGEYAEEDEYEEA